MRSGLIYVLVAALLAAPVRPVLAADPTPGVVQSAGPFIIDSAHADQNALFCPSLGDLAVADTPMVHVRRALQPGERLDVLAVGSATVLGPDASHPDIGFPFRMVQALKLAAPQSDITLTLRGGKGLTAEESRAALSEALATHSYQLVLWQTGTVEAVRGMPAQNLYDTLTSGVTLLKDASDLILVDPQYSRMLQANTNLEPYLSAMARAGSLSGVVLFHRFDLMRHWADQGLIDLERAAPADRLATADHLHACLGRALARMVLAGAGMHAAR